MAEQERSARRERGTGTGRAAAVTRLAWVAVLVLTAVFHVIRGAPVDALIYGAGAVLLALDQLGWLRVPLRLRAESGAVSRRLVVGVLIGVAALTLALSPLYGGADTAVVVGIGLLLLPVAWADRAEPAALDSPTPDAERRAVRRAAVLWSAVIAAGCAWEIAAFFLGRGLPDREQEFPALSDLLDPLIAWPPARAVLVALWLLGGYALVRRGWRR
ncbi:hypothetical protein [Leifsonia sp. SIMBA_070]|uniref:hypothetical protein n=1 Tax=Leifsonia sp. SIMBA_070 TaxID=3085810 RepID=UPI0039783063